MAITRRIANALNALFGYQASDGTGSHRRTQSQLTNMSEDVILNQQQRLTISCTTRDLLRNMSIAGWAIRKHLDYVSTFTFEARTGNKGLDTLLKTRVEEWSQPSLFDASQVMGRETFVRTMEQCRTLDGDVLVLRINDGRIQAIESDRIKQPESSPGFRISALDQWVNGVHVVNGIASEYAVWKRTPNGMVPGNFVSAKDCFPLFAYRPRFDCVRGISPMAPAINSFVDLHDSITYALSKMKLSQLFGLVFTQAGDRFPGIVTANSGDPADGSEGYMVDWKKGPVVLNLRPGDEAKFLESQTPSQEFQNFVQVTIPMCLKALDIPYSFYDEAYSTYSGSRQALLQYEQSAKGKRIEIQRFLDEWVEWRIKMGILAGQLPPTIPMVWEWIPAGLPWVNPLQESSANAIEVGLGTKSRSMICKERGYDFDDVLDQLQSENTKLIAAGMTPVLPTMQINVGTGGADEPSKQKVK